MQTVDNTNDDPSEDMLNKARLMLADLECQVCDIEDTSAAHRGHQGNSGGAHLIMTLVSERFAGLNLLQRERLVTDRFKVYIPHQIHAISVRSYTPEEYRSSTNVSSSTPL